MSEIKEYRQCAQSLVRMNVAIRMMDEVSFRGMGPEAIAECEDITNRMIVLAETIGRRLIELQHELEGAQE